MACRRSLLHSCMNIEMLRDYCLRLPAATEEIKWDNDLCFCVGGKMFCVAALEGASRVAFKVKDDEFDELSTSPGMIPAPYMARAKWVQVLLFDTLDDRSWKSYIEQSYNLVKAKLTRKVRKELGIDG